MNFLVKYKTRFKFVNSFKKLTEKHLLKLFKNAVMKNNPLENCEYSREFQAMLDGLEYEDTSEEYGQSAEKKKRLTVEQVKALEAIFELDNKLDPERKVKLAQELGLQPRQVSIWFQNRRARWKTKILERDYNNLKANYEALKHNYQKLEKEKESYVLEVNLNMSVSFFFFLFSFF